MREIKQIETKISNSLSNLFCWAICGGMPEREIEHNTRQAIDNINLRSIDIYESIESEKNIPQIFKDTNKLVYNLCRTDENSLAFTSAKNIYESFNSKPIDTDNENRLRTNEQISFSNLFINLAKILIDNNETRLAQSALDLTNKLHKTDEMLEDATKLQKLIPQSSNPQPLLQ